ncbi:MAG: hypothetical protein PUF06_06265 [Veillonellaceae bacterium]|nr:hypothetical protein [Veillonellaceae bacterium]MCI7234760.1 hypothetical protein [Veillonellaceae bacterium]MDD6562715.1 hypothetical protein [Veillonellaceae bacterium]MDD7655374.1 hypothetical protein [Veillonellaceae bacterium]MDY5052544.1 hypothetical protein [Anaerovibrio sp.]
MQYRAPQALGTLLILARSEWQRRDFMAAEQENSEQASTLLGKHKRQVLAGAAVVLVSLGALWAYLMWGAVKPETVVAEPVIGVLDMQQLIKAHPDYGRLQEIQRDIDHLENALALEDIKLPQTAPTPEKELFQEAAGQKSRLDSLARHDQLVHQLNAMAEKKRQELRPKFEAEHQEAEQKYLNEMLNLRIKIDSADVLGLTPEQVQEMQVRIESLQQQRGQVVAQLTKEQEERFRQLMAQEAAGPMAELQRLEAQTKQELQQAELDKELEVQNRNAQAMEQAVSPVESKINTAKKRALLEGRKIQLRQIQDKIRNDIAGRAAKLAIMHKLTLILASPADNLRGIDYENLGAGKWEPTLSPVIGINTLDLTEEMLQEMKQQPFQPIGADK